MIHFLDITKEHCPMTFVKTKLKLEQIQSGDMLEILLCDGEPLRNVPKTVETHGHQVLTIEKKNAYYKVIVKKL